jgi:hypothetical protein
MWFAVIQHSAISLSKSHFKSNSFSFFSVQSVYGNALFAGNLFSMWFFVILFNLSRSSTWVFIISSTNGSASNYLSYFWASYVHKFIRRVWINLRSILWSYANTSFSSRRLYEIIFQLKFAVFIKSGWLSAPPPVLARWRGVSAGVSRTIFACPDKAWQRWKLQEVFTICGSSLIFLPSEWVVVEATIYHPLYGHLFTTEVPRGTKRSGSNSQIA